ncbi:putative multi-pass transmembrane protein [Trypanosoma theileri]|uniref:Putative multi-pass transmembrane protein n=1 Tax=Trypanosoma theileri TaxID=67003 RepID=A0A1X0NWM1_9TRYP|nr:putative multi-pass transmembrane protein [Trypanosoma theileri]ORC88873.1 putative multi-pass transmembrane protein [Trypanosoma theileri]
MAISEKACLRIRVVLYVLFAVSYAVGAIIFIREFNNYLAASGFAIACFFIGVATVLYAIPDKKLYSIFPAGSKSRICFQLSSLIITLGFIGLALYALGEGIKRRQAWKGDSYFCSFIALLTSAKWSFFCGLRIHRVRDDFVEDDDDKNIEEKVRLFEGSHDMWGEEEKVTV